MKADDERRDRLRGPGQIGERRAGDDDGFAERDNDEAGAALRHVAALDDPVGHRRRTVYRNPEPDRRRDIFDGQCYSPEDQPLLSFRKAAADRRTGPTSTARPGRGIAFIAPAAASAASTRPKYRSADLHRGIGGGERQSRDSNAFGIEVESTSPPSISRNSRIRTGVSSGLNQSAIQEAQAPTPTTPPRNKSVVLQCPERGEMRKQRVRDPRDREHKTRSNSNRHRRRAHAGSAQAGRNSAPRRRHPPWPPCSGQNSVPAPRHPVCSASAKHPPIWPRSDLIDDPTSREPASAVERFEITVAA